MQQSKFAAEFFKVIILKYVLVLHDIVVKKGLTFSGVPL